MAGTVRVTSEGAYVELYFLAKNKVTALGTYVEYGLPAMLRVTSLGAYVEHDPPPASTMRLLPALGVGN